MNVKEKELLKEKVKEVLWEHKGLQSDKVRAKDYIDLYESSLNPTLDILVRELSDIFEIKSKDEGLMRFED